MGSKATGEAVPPAGPTWERHPPRTLAGPSDVTARGGEPSHQGDHQSRRARSRAGCSPAFHRGVARSQPPTTRSRHRRGRPDPRVPQPRRGGSFRWPRLAWWRPTLSNDPLPPSKEEVIEAIQRDPATYRKARLIPRSIWGGRPRMYPNWVHILVNEFLPYADSRPKAIAELREPRTWQEIRQRAMEMFPDDDQKSAEERMVPPEEPISVHHFKYVKNTYMARNDILHELARVHREDAAELAQIAGNFADGGPRRTMKPTLE